ncbi:MAG: hypothetical protein ACFCUE_04625 [Candidatus Bathyarchaeia archaeon]
MSAKLKELLNVVANEKCQRERVEVEQGMSSYKKLLLKIKAEKKMDLTTVVEGVEQQNASKQAEDLKTLEKAGLVTGETKYTHRNTYLEYTLTAKGADLAEKLSIER